MKSATVCCGLQQVTTSSGQTQLVITKHKMKTQIRSVLRTSNKNIDLVCFLL